MLHIWLLTRLFAAHVGQLMGPPAGSGAGASAQASASGQQQGGQAGQGPAQGGASGAGGGGGGQQQGSQQEQPLPPYMVAHSLLMVPLLVEVGPPLRCRESGWEGGKRGGTVGQ